MKDVAYRNALIELTSQAQQDMDHLTKTHMGLPSKASKEVKDRVALLMQKHKNDTEPLPFRQRRD